jgi:2-polyprenyl-3-methyl-5-hydroxy-6-metoxy-1,4-benzoquinol methylase
MEYLTQCLACNSLDFEPFIQTNAMMHPASQKEYNFDRCNACGLVFLNPRVEESNLSQFYTRSYLPYRIEEAWGRYASFVKMDQHYIDLARVKRLNQHHKLTGESRILDVGCGKPTFLACLRKITKAHLMGLDFSDEGWIHRPQDYANIDLRIGEIDDLKLETAVDVITLWHYLEHDYNPQGHLMQLLNSAHPQTKLIIEVPNFDSHTRRKFGKHWSGYHTPRHTALYSPNNIELMLSNSGWRVETILTHGTLNPYTLHWMSKMEQQQIDWTASMEGRFVKYVMGMILRWPFYGLHKVKSMGFMTVVATPKSRVDIS